MKLFLSVMARLGVIMLFARLDKPISAMKLCLTTTKFLATPFYQLTHKLYRQYRMGLLNGWVLQKDSPNLYLYNNNRLIIDQKVDRIHVFGNTNMMYRYDYVVIYNGHLHDNQDWLKLHLEDGVWHARGIYLSINIPLTDSANLWSSIQEFATYIQQQGFTLSQNSIPDFRI